MFFRRELALLNELSDTDRRYSKNFSRAFGCDEAHQIYVNREGCGLAGQPLLNLRFYFTCFAFFADCVSAR